MSGVDPGFKKKFDTTKVSVEELKMCKMEDARRPPGKGPSPGSTLHQQGGRGSWSGRYPVVLAGVAVLTSISTFFYYRSVHVQPLHGNDNQATLDSIHVATANAPADAPRSINVQPLHGNNNQATGFRPCRHCQCACGCPANLYDGMKDSPLASSGSALFNRLTGFGGKG